MRVNRRPVSKSSATIRVGDVLTFPQGSRIRVVEIRNLGTRRGPAPEAATLYHDLTPATDDSADAAAAAPAPRGRPTKSDRRAITRLKQGPASDI